MSRSAWKGKFYDNYLLKKKFLNRRKKNIWTRNNAIPASLIGKSVFIHNGNKFIKILVTRKKVGFKFGEFSFTRELKPKKNDWAPAKKPKKAVKKPTLNKKGK